MRHVIEGLVVFSALWSVVLTVDNIRLRRRLHVDRLVREAEEALGLPCIGDIVMPDPSDPRWKREEQHFTSPAGSGNVKKVVLALDQIAVTDDARVYIGAGPPVEGGEIYAKRVLHAYRRRLVEAARGST